MADRKRLPARYRVPPPQAKAAGRAGRGLQAGLVLGAVFGALLLAVAELTTLFTIHIAARRAPVRSVATGPHDSWALMPIVALVLLLAWAVWRHGSRVSLLAIGLLGLAALLLALLRDLPDAQANGIIKLGGLLHPATASPSTGLYMETLGAVVLLITCVGGFILIGPPLPREQAADG